LKLEIQTDGKGQDPASACYGCKEEKDSGKSKSWTENMM